MGRYYDESMGGPSAQADVFANLNKNIDKVGNVLLQEKLRKKQEEEELQKQIKLLQIKQQLETADPLSQLLKQGQVADAQMKIFNAGGPAPTLFKGQPATAQNTIEKLTAINPPPEQPKFDGQIGPSTITPTPQYQAKELDAFGRPKGFSLKEPSAAEDKRNVESRELSGQTKNIMELFNDAMIEAKGNSADVGKEGLGGRLANLSTIMAGKAGYSPNVNIFQERIKAFATVTAKQAGEQRPTDADIERFIGAMMNFKNNDKENAIQMAQQLKDLQARGSNIDWAIPIVDQYEKITGTNVKIDAGSQPIQQLPNPQTSLNFRSEEEAASANLPSGTKITINGRPAIWE